MAFVLPLLEGVLATLLLRAPHSSSRTRHAKLVGAGFFAVWVMICVVFQADHSPWFWYLNAWWVGVLLVVSVVLFLIVGDDRPVQSSISRQNHHVV
jgi:hypothetical protein